MKKQYLLTITLLLSVSIYLSSCDDDVAPIENPEETITEVTLNFTPQGGGSTLQFVATDPDGTGPADMQAEDSISLQAGTSYILTIEFENTIANVSITQEIAEEAEEHILFYEWTEGLFSDPAGNGNIDNREDPVRYNDFDNNSQPLGLNTTWTTNGPGTGDFRIVLKHQPNIKSATSTVDDGETDVDVTWGIKVQ